ncbi:MAG: hypothetical protein KKF46_02680 [Nanoarchaeota archaeon]|nr:hypothetical protein [Nanoarchaeota archaeon]MBU1321237.1 hypothetical protein [Nanoarchaeota archaeon]
MIRGEGMRKKTLTTFIFLATLAILTIPLLMLTSGAGTDTFASNVTIDNTGPEILSTNATSTAPSSATTKVIQLELNVTDNNTVTDLNPSSIVMNITYTGETTRSATSSDCWSVANSSDNLQGVFWCNVTIYYYDREASWTINAYIADDSAVGDSDTAGTFGMGTLDDVDVINASILLQGNAGEQNVGPALVLINNTGNQNYTGLDVTGYNLTANSFNIDASAFTVNVTDGSGVGQALTHAGATSVTSAVLLRGTGASSDEEFYFYVDIPTGLEDDTYDSTSNWIIDPTGPS